MTNARHGKQTLAQGVHGIVALEYADAAARTGDTTLQAYDKYKVAKQLDNGSCWLLINHDPVTWQDLGAGVPASHGTTHEDGGADEIDVTGLSGLLADPQTPATHASTHERAGSDEIDGDHLDVDYTPTNYAPDITPPEAAHVDDLAAHLAGIDNALLPYSDKAGSSIDTTTTSTTDVLVDSMTITPPAGTYAVWFAGSTENGNYPRENLMSIYAGGVREEDSEVHSSWYRSDIPSAFCCVAKVTVNGSQAIEGRWRVSSGTGLMRHRTLLIIEVRP
jgi:hypothetical protein